jgi:DNA mismatch endonuclease (patch repair protein)
MAVFADGCFWHGCNCKKLKPVANRQYWETKIEKNKKPDPMPISNVLIRGFVVNMGGAEQP